MEQPWAVTEPLGWEVRAELIAETLGSCPWSAQRYAWREGMVAGLLCSGHSAASQGSKPHWCQNPKGEGTDEGTTLHTPIQDSALQGWEFESPKAEPHTTGTHQSITFGQAVMSRRLPCCCKQGWCGAAAGTLPPACSTEPAGSLPDEVRLFYALSL